MISEREISSSLDAIERHEARFLAWGILDRAMTRNEVESLIRSESSVSESDIFTELRRRQLIFEIPQSSPPNYRSRMAEGVRLFTRLRQQFPDQPWQTAPRLVADFRFLVRPRRFPVRIYDVDAVTSRLEDFSRVPRTRSALGTLLGAVGESPARRLSRFQLEASAEILRGLASDFDRGCIVTAGTGSGKTLAFYLPTLLHLMADPSVTGGSRVLAVYPRNELLKDQLLATLREIRRMRAGDSTLPRVRIGAYFGPTPFEGGTRPLPDYLGWWSRKDSSGSICPFLVCPGQPAGSECGGRMLWHDSDRRSKIDRLVCESCGVEIGSSELLITRRAMQQQPPDILFTTTEMLNRSLSDGWSSHIFGVGRTNAHPRLVLLDEAHTYSGPSGAQAAYVLRRWRHLAGGPVMWVGLSATLRDAEQFFSKLTGVPADFVREVSPSAEDLEERGHEYQLLLRGDPASQTALLSTSIQTLMLLLRLLDPLGHNPSQGMFGHKVFAFCDNLDLTNRLYRQLLDAEGRDPLGKPNPRRRGSLALLRSFDNHPSGHEVQDWISRDHDGQYWWLVDELRGTPVPPVIGRTSSQDTGVTANAETIVATASLEVGYDDPDVGAVLQHKSPRDLAQFVQRRGRGGRSQSMRPWTVLVLSDYGRDRLAYQSYERLFDPVLPPKSLPLANRSVRRMQATFAVIDWVAERLRRENNGYRDAVRDYFTQPLDGDKRTRQLQAARLLQEVLHDGDARGELAVFLQRSLRLSPEDVDVILWEGPRSLLLEAIPTAARRIEANWQVVRDGRVVPRGDRIRTNHPLPDFVPGNLFSDLCLPEIQIVPPESYDAAADTEEPAFLALNEFAPGNVTLRYAVWKTRGLWVSPGAGGRLDISASLARDADTVAQIRLPSGDEVDVVRPFALFPEITPPAIQTTSKGQLHWQARISPVHKSIEADLPDIHAWRKVIEQAEFFLQAGRGGINLLRYALGGTAEVGEARRGRTRRSYEFCRGEESVALGVDLEVDAMRIRIRAPHDLSAFRLDSDQRRLRQLRRDYFLWHVEETVGRSEESNPFIAAWVAEMFLASVALGSLERAGQVDPGSWDVSEWKARLLDAFDQIFQGVDASGTEDLEETPLREAVAESVAQDSVRETLLTIWSCLESPQDLNWYEWIRDRFAVTAAAAIHTAIQAVLPDFDAERDLAIDLVTDRETIDIWISDVAVGGGGLVETLYAVYAEDPRRFWNLALAALKADDLEQASGLLPRVAEILSDELADAAADYRQAPDDERALAAWKSLMLRLSQEGIPPSHALAVAISTRLMQLGSSDASDLAVSEAMAVWEQVEKSVGFALDQRTACAVVSTNERVIRGLRAAVPDANSSQGAAWAVGVLLGILWAPPEAIRGQAFRLPMPFSRRHVPSERTLVLDVLPENGAVVDLNQTGWRAAADSVLATRGSCTLRSAARAPQALHDAIVDFMVRPTEVGTLHLHPRVLEYRRDVGIAEVDLELVEAPQ